VDDERRRGDPGQAAVGVVQAGGEQLLAVRALAEGRGQPLRDVLVDALGQRGP
jgi:hypothetical protein